MSPGWAQEAHPDAIRFSTDVLPILAENCFTCHGFDQAARQAELRLDTRAGAMAQRDGAAVIVPGDPDASELIRRIDSRDPLERMPPPDSGKLLTKSQRQLLRRWIEEGGEYETHWSFHVPTRNDPPQVDGEDHPIDRFIRARLPQAGLRPSEPAAAETRLRRLCLDLTGLPPTVEEIDAFLAAHEKDPSRAWEVSIKRLLASPHYGERWGRWWLDQARYADSNGYSIDAPRSIWKYRDWVVEALNRDTPFDQFTIEQLAGDLLPAATQGQRVATGFHRNTQINQEGGIDREQYRVDSVFDRVATTGTVWLGLTIGCAQCHDHKFDPITQKEFYQLFAFFNSQDEPTMRVYPPEVDVAAINSQRADIEAKLRELLKSHERQRQEWEASLSDVDREAASAAVRKALQVAQGKRNLDQQLELYLAGAGAEDKQCQSWRKQLRQLESTLNAAPTTMVFRERPQPRASHVLIKGDFTRPAETVSPGAPGVLHPFEHDGAANRLHLAEWIVSGRNPLTARVIVNRVWQQYFGQGLVTTENDFGLLGARPSHPELLDWLAVEFMDGGWSFKQLHRLIVTSKTYQQSSKVRADLAAHDPGNRLLGRQVRLRLDAEIIRDVALTASGLLNGKIGGPPVFPPIPEGVMGQGQVKRAWKVSTGGDRYRRGIYTFIYRSTPPPSLNVFDAPDGFSTCTRRNRSNTPLQSLTLMNDAAFFEFAEALERRIESEGLGTVFRRCTGRRPERDELALLEQLDTLTAARTLLNLDETITRE